MLDLSPSLAVRPATVRGVAWRSGVYPVLIVAALLSTSAAAPAPASARAPLQPHQRSSAAPASPDAARLPSLALALALEPHLVPQDQPHATPRTVPPPAAPSQPSEAASAPPAQPESFPTQASLAADTAGQPCHSADYFAPAIGEWSVPPSCYGLIYAPDPASYRARDPFGWCAWWPEALNPGQPDLLSGAEYGRGAVPVPGAVVYEAGGVQGASPDGHYAQVVAIAPGGYWLLVTEMNFGWRGGGFGKVDYRYIHVGPGISFIYP